MNRRNGPTLLLAAWTWLGAAAAATSEPLPSNAEMEQLAKRDAVIFLRNCLKRYDEQVKTGFRCTLRKQERIDGTLNKKEIIKVSFQEKPHGVYLEWVEGALLAARVLYVDGENGDKLVAKLKSFGLVVTRDPDGADARKSGRYSLKEFGLKKAMLRTLSAWTEARKNNALHVEYVGKQKVKEAGERECWVLRRSKFKKPEEDGIEEMIIFVDTKTWLQVGTILKDKNGKLLGEYFFRDVEIDPAFAKDQFTRGALSR